MSDVTTFHCYDCGILMGIDSDVVTSWKKSHKNFTCPNGHVQHWGDESVQEKEISSLKAEVKTLKTKLEAADKLAEEQTKKLAEMTTELEIWRPSTTDKDETNGSKQVSTGD